MRAEAEAVVVVGGVETLDSELETRRGVLAGLEPGGMVWFGSVMDLMKQITVSFTRRLFFSWFRIVKQGSPMRFIDRQIGSC